jgi:crotonobetaine/carnitine-CoA ligase
MNATVPSTLAVRAGHEPDGVCLIEAETGERITNHALWQDSLRIAERLATLDVGPGDTVASMLTHSIDTYRAWFALAVLGALEVPIGTRHRGRLLRHILNDSGARVLIIDVEFLPALETALREETVPALKTVIVRGARSQRVDVDGVATLSLADLNHDADPEPPRRLPQPHDLAAVIYTSGTTGPSKGVLVPWDQVHATATGMFPPDTVAGEKVVYGPFPPNHIGGRLFASLGILYGVPAVIRHAFSASAFWADVEKYHCTTTALVAAMASILFNAPGRDDDARNRLEDVLMVPLIAQFEDFASRFGVRVCTSFNMTEVSIPIVTGWAIDDWHSCGEVRTGFPGYQLRVVDEHDYPLGPGHVGELVCRTDSPWAMNAGYYGRPTESAAAWRNGWFHTGDAFRYDERGRYYFVDRAKDAIRRRGENVSSIEVEQELLDHPEIVGCAAIGVPSELGEEDIKVFVVRRPGSELTEATVLEHVAAKAASFMVPRFVEFVDSLPVTEGTDKVKKAELRELERRRRRETS